LFFATRRTFLLSARSLSASASTFSGWLATTYVMLADPLSSYVSGATIAVTGGKPIL
jgi:hypothetical protein